ncbi:MAG: hypothetical protein GF316_18195 [Candidatus Lokiarchaeota archaeon]|nr:hypothetical protein [Candidatus Lokiarchaeota archaeon]
MKPYKHRFSEKESDVTIISDSQDAIIKAKESFYYHRKVIEEFVKKNKVFLKSFSPVKLKSNQPIIRLMLNASEIFDVGPMAAVAGALADIMLDTMRNTSREEYILPRIALVENGGEIAIDSKEELTIALFAGNNELNLNLGFKIQEKDCPIGIGTSSATIGHAISLGNADAVTVFAKNATLADTGATKIANMVQGDDIEKSIKNALDVADDIDEIQGVFINRENQIGKTGKLPTIVKIEGNKDKIIAGFRKK